MRIDRNEPICGVRPALLKKLFRRDVFDTVTALTELGLVEPDASRMLVALERDEWVMYDGCIDYVDRWRAREKAHRLCATPLIKRFPISEGRRIAAQVVEEARMINRVPACSCRITAITLFGSVLTGREDDDAGDIDLVVDIRPRSLAEEESEIIELAEAAAMPASLDFTQRLYRVEKQICRQLKKVSNKISLHARHDLDAIGAPHYLLYSYDIEREREIPVVTKLNPPAKVAGQPKKRREMAAAACSISPLRTEWPVAPNPKVRIESLALAQLLEMQHMWVKKAPLSVIARSTRMPEESVLAYLASRRNVQRYAAPFRASLGAMIGATIAPNNKYSIAVRVEKRPVGDLCVRTTIHDRNKFAERASISHYTQAGPWFDGRCDLLPHLEPAAAAAWAWYQKMRPSLKGFGVDFCNLCNADTINDAPGEKRPIDFQPLKQPMLDLLKSFLPVPRSRCEALSHRVEIRFGDAMEINHRHARRTGRKPRVCRISRVDAGRLWNMARDFQDSHAEALGMDRQWTIYVDGSALPDYGMTPGEIVDD